MLRHYITVALRNLFKDGRYAVINLVSLALAITCALALSLYVSGELTYDASHAKHRSIVRVVNEITANGQSGRYALTSRALGPLFIKENPRTATYVRIRNLAVARAAFRYKDVAKYWNNVKIADENVFDVFSHQALYGDLRGALQDPSSIVVSESFARSYFGDRNPVGETVSSDTYDYRIAAVFKDLPRNTHLRYDALISMKRLRSFGLDELSSSPEQLFDIENYTYFLLQPGMDRASFDARLRSFGAKYSDSIGSRIHASIRFSSQALTGTHFDTRYRYDQPTGNIIYVYGFIAVALFLITIASINYTNLAIARAMRRSKEIGMRRVLGATQAQLVAQFLGESVCLALMAALVGIGLLLALGNVPSLGDWFGSGAHLELLADPLVLLWVLAGAVAVGVLAGLYPAVYLSSISAQAAITSQRSMRAARFGLRESLVFVQFLVSIGIVASTMIMNRQLDFVASVPLGFERDDRIAVVIRGVDAIERIPTLSTQLLRNPDILSVTESSFVPGDEVAASFVKVEAQAGEMQEVTVNRVAVGRDFVADMGIRVLEGRDFSQRMLTDVGAAVLVNESLVRLMGWEQPIGKRIAQDGRVIGVIRDFHFSSLHSAVGPMMLHQFRKDELQEVADNQRNLVTRSMIVTIRSGAMNSALATLRQAVTSFDPRHPFEYAFFTDLLDRQYASEALTMRLTGFFSMVCLLISCLGLFGLAALTTEQRTKEIGIRKVLGASPRSIVMLLSRGLLMLVIAAACAASVVTFFLMQRWLETFVYRTDIHYGIFVSAAAGAAVLAWLAVAIQAGRKAQQDPILALRYE